MELEHLNLGFEKRWPLEDGDVVQKLRRFYLHRDVSWPKRPKLWPGMAQKLRTAKEKAEVFETISGAVRSGCLPYWTEFVRLQANIIALLFLILVAGFWCVMFHVVVIPLSFFQMLSYWDLRLDEMAKLVAVLHLMPGEPIFTTESLDESATCMRIVFMPCISPEDMSITWFVQPCPILMACQGVLYWRRSYRA